MISLLVAATLVLPAHGFVEHWPILEPGVESRYFSSFDRGGGNDDGFNGSYSELYQDARGEHVIFDAVGPGRLRTLWFTSEIDGHGKLSLGRVRFYFDDEPEPRVAMEANQLFEGRTAPFLSPLVANNFISTGGFASWVPMDFAKRLKITTEHKAFFYIAQYDLLPVDTRLQSWTKTGLKPMRNLFLSAANPPVLRMRPLPLSSEHRGQGVLRCIQFKPDHPPAKLALQTARIRIWWDGEPNPSVDCPLGMFFGCGLGESRVQAIPFSMRDGVYQNRFPMPFWRGFRLEIEGMNGALSVSISRQAYRQTEAGHFHASYRQEHPTTTGRDFVFLEKSGAGKLVGTILLVEPASANEKRWWEGDLRSYTNGKRTPGLHGTGHEDDHLGGWSNEFLDAPFTLPMHGEPAVEMMTREGQYNGPCSLYRLWPGINFVDGIRHSVEHGTENRVNYPYSGVSFFYATETWNCQETDRLELGDARLADLGSGEELTSAFEGREYRQKVTLKHAGATNSLSFSVRLNPAAKGVFLRRVYDQASGRQRATILIDGQPLGDWYAPEQNKILRWAERDYFVPGRFIRGKSSVRVTLAPTPGHPPFDLSSLVVRCVLSNSL